MTKRGLALIAVPGLVGPAASATELDLFLTWNGVMDEITVVPGAVISYEVSAILAHERNASACAYRVEVRLLKEVGTELGILRDGDMPEVKLDDTRPEP